MAKVKVTITLNRAKAEQARGLVGARSTSQVVDIALDCLVRAEQLRQDVEAYRRVPPSDDERALADSGETATLLDDTDWEALYEAERA